MARAGASSVGVHQIFADFLMPRFGPGSLRGELHHGFRSASYTGCAPAVELDNLRVYKRENSRVRGRFCWRRARASATQIRAPIANKISTQLPLFAFCRALGRSPGGRGVGRRGEEVACQDARGRSDAPVSVVVRC